MKTKTLLKTTGITIMIILLTTFITNSQIQIQGLHVDHEGTASWDADGSGPEPEGYGHPHPFGWANTPYYGASCDYDDIDPDPDAALAHFLDDISGFPLFEQALIDNGFSPAQVKIKNGLMNLKEDVEGEDWFTLNNQHHFNYYDAIFTIELNGEPMISGYINYGLFSYNQSVYNSWQLEGNFTKPYDVSENSSLPVQEVTAAFLADMDGEEIRLKYENMQSTGIPFNGNGRDGMFFEIVSGYLEKGLPELPFSGLAADNEGIAIWNADGTGPEPEAYGHTFSWGGNTFNSSYYLSSRDYDGIDPDPNAALCHFTENGTGFPNLEIQLDYRGFTIDQLKVKSSMATHGNDIEGEDWGVDGSIYWYNYYGNTGTIEIAGEPILEYVIDTNFSFLDLSSNDNWESNMSNCKVVDISANASSDAQQVAASFLKDLGGHSLGSYMEGYYVGDMISTNGRDGVYHEIESGILTAKLPSGTHIWDNEVSGTWVLDGSPYIVMDSLKIPDGETLEIEEGVVVKFNTTEMFLIDGCIIAEGTQEQPILFTALDNSVRWGGIGWDQTLVSNETSILKHCIFEYAYAYNPDNILGYNSGGAVSVNGYENIEISHCIFRYNLAAEPGENGPTGGAIILNESSLHISHCIFYDNQAGHGGAMTLVSNSNAIIDNCLFYDNEAVDWYGGAILTYIDCSPTFINCTFADNYAINGGGVAELQHGGIATFTNCIMWGNDAGNGYTQIRSYDPAICELHIYYCDVEEGTNGIDPGIQLEYEDNLEIYPEFLGPGEDFLYALSGGSQCINYGTLDPLYLPAGWVCPEFCLGGNPRVLESVIDLGCYEGLFTEYNEPGNLNESSINVFPNPINSNPTIEFYLKNRGVVNISILDIHGRVISEIKTGELQSGKNQLTWNVENISAGVYFCRLQTGNEEEIMKLIKLE